MLSLVAQMVLLGRVALVGAGLAFCWDVYRSLRVVSGVRRSPFSFALDLAFFAVMAPIAFVLLLVADGAQWRLATIVGIGIGMLAYRLTLGGLVVGVVWGAASAIAWAARRIVGIWWWLVRRVRPWGVP